MTSQREALSAEISEEGSPDDVIRKLKGELVILSRQAEVSDMELQTLRKQIVKESKKGQDLSKEMKGTNWRKSLKRWKSKSMSTVTCRAKEGIHGLCGWIETRTESRKGFKFQSPVTTSENARNAELILAVQDLDEMLEQKQKSNCSVDQKLQENNTKPETDDDDEDQKALMEIVREHSGLQDVHLQEQKIIDLYNEI